MKFYKYMTLDRGADFLKCPLIRLSNSSCLNDPFEFSITKSSGAKVEKILGEALKDQYNNSEIFKRFWTHGVISLTETNDNLLMWSHYADEHKGMVVEFDIDLKNPFIFFDLNKEYTGSTFSKVFYRKDRKFKDEISLENLDKVRLHYMLNKSEEWIYEKEYRFIIPYNEADILLLDKNNPLFENIINNIGISAKDIKYQENKAILEIKKYEVAPDVLFKIWILSSHLNAIFLKIVNPYVINSVYLGCKVDPMSTHQLFAEEIYKHIKERFFDSENNSICNVFKSNASSDRFELRFDKCTASILDRIR